jgi:Sulfotransferase domain/N-terminal domain of galactosyltransferase
LPRPRIAFVTTCKNRAQHLKHTLPKNLADNAAYENLVFVVLDYNSQDDLGEFLRTQCGEAIKSGRLVIYSYLDAEKFCMAHAKNVAHRCGILEGAEILVNVDADNFTGPGFAVYVAEKFEQENIFLWARMIKSGPDRLPRGISGRIAVTAKAFLLAGGYDEKYETWGPDDKDFNLRLRNLGFERVEIDRCYLSSVPHNERMRFKEYPHIYSNPDYDSAFEIGCSTEITIANFGAFGCGTVYRNFCSDALRYFRNRPEGIQNGIQLAPLPTRIFGIGMHKTATTSLHFALQALGFDSAHWLSTQWVRQIWREMNWFGRSKTLEGHYALCDLPIPLLFRLLDGAYPGSKFVLTIRREDLWLKSVQDHWNPETNPYRAGWDSDAFSHRMHELLYGRRDFDAPTMLARYRKHNADVLAYFKNRPGDLLTMNMDDGAGWPELCGFLGKPIPASAYPRKFKTRTR